MRHIFHRSAGLALVAAGLGLAACSHQAEAPARPAGEAAKPAFPVGPHGGRLLEDGAIAVELVMHEAEGAPPRFHAYVTRDEQPVAPAAVGLDVALHRLGGEVTRLGFSPEGDHLVSNGIVEEPHSFDVEVAARVDGRPHGWRYASHEGRLKLGDAEAGAKGIRIETAGPQTLHVTKAVGGAVVAGAPGIQFNLNRADMDDVRVGQSVELATMDGRSLGRSTVTAIKPPFEEGSRATIMTVGLPAGAVSLPLGTPIRGTIIVGDQAVPLAVRTTALQYFRNFRVVMAKFGDSYEVRMLELGRQTPEWTEIKAGLKPGTSYAAGNVFALGAQLDKNSAATVHGH